MKKYSSISQLLILQISAVASFGQSNYNSEEALINDAHDFFIKERYTNAASLYAQLLSTHPQNTAYHQNYGVSLLYSSKNKTEAIHHLLIAALANKTANDEVNYFLAKAYHADYEFKKALDLLEKINTISKENKAITPKIDVLSAQCKNALAYNFSSYEQFIISKIETQETEANNFYTFENYSGKFLAMPEKFIKVKNTNEKYSKNVFLSPSGNTIVFSIHAKSGENELYISRKKSGLEWDNGELIKFKNPLVGDKISPAISFDGETLYFSWNGLKSSGGFDVFKSSYDLNTKLWSDPVNLGPPINSVFDDFNYVPSSESSFAYLCSTRDCDEEKINVIKIDLKNLTSFLNSPPKNKTNQDSTINNLHSKTTNDKPSVTENKTVDATVSSQQITSKEAETNSTQIENQHILVTTETPITTSKQLVVKGFFYSIAQPLNMKAKIIAVNQNDSSKIFTSETNPETGEYTLHLPTAENYYINFEQEGLHKSNQLLELKKENDAEIKHQLVFYKDTSGAEQFWMDVMSQKKSADEINPAKIVYKIQIGVFREKTIEVITEKFKSLGIKNINWQSKVSGENVFYTGETNQLFEALKHRKELMEKGVHDAFIVAFMGTNQISIDESLSIKK